MNTPEQNLMIAELSTLYPWPKVNLDKLKPFYWSIDGGGKSLVDNVIAENKVTLMAEIGVYLGGSCLR